MGTAVLGQSLTHLELPTASILALAVGCCPLYSVVRLC